MSFVQPLPVLYRRLWSKVAVRRRLQLAGLALLMLGAAVAEVISIGAVLPFLTALTSPDRIMEVKMVRPVLAALGIESPREALFAFTLAFIVAALAAAALRLLLMWAQVRLSNAIGSDFSIQAYQRILFQEYRWHVARNSSEIMAGLGKAGALAAAMIQPALHLVSGSVILLGVLVTIFTIDPVVALSSIGGFGAIYAVTLAVTRPRLAQVSQTLALQTGRMTKSIQEGLGGIRDILIDGYQGTYVQLYLSALRPMHRAGASLAFIENSPRYCVEALGMVLIGILSYVLARSETDISQAVPVLGSLALAAQRMLPLLQNLYSNFVRIRGSQAGIQDALDLLEEPMPACRDPRATAPLPFRDALEVRGLHFRYTPTTPWVIRGLNLRIPRGSRVGFIGATGSGKSTLIDILMGLLPPDEGQLLIDGKPLYPDNIRGWRAHLAHVPQAIYLADISIAENIAFGVPPERIDRDRVRLAARQAQIAEAIEAWSDGYDTLVGERGVRLSGGQRQRIGIARALYKRADVIVFDEATSALDNQTETAVMAAIEGLDPDLTILIVAHRLTTLRGCDQIVELEQGSIRRIGTYREIIESPQGKSPPAPAPEACHDAAP